MPYILRDEVSGRAISFLYISMEETREYLMIYRGPCFLVVV